MAARGAARRLLAYVSVAPAGLEGETLTGHVTFVADHPGLPPYVGAVDSYETEALIVLSAGDTGEFMSAGSSASAGGDAAG